jgi:hypothetical protein
MEYNATINHVEITKEKEETKMDFKKRLTFVNVTEFSTVKLAVNGDISTQ